MARKSVQEPQVVEITTAAGSRAEEIAGRQRRYIISMSIRTLCFVGAVALYSTNMWIAWVLIAGSFLLPSVAVLAANAGAELRAGTPEVVDPWDVQGTRALPPGRAGETR